MGPLHIAFAAAIVQATFIYSPVLSKSPHKLQRDLADAFEIFDKFPYVVLVYTSGDDPEFQCLTNKRTELDMDAKKATYVWMFKGHNGSERSLTKYEIARKSRNRTLANVNADVTMGILPRKAFHIGKNVALHLSAGDAPDWAVFTLNNDTEHSSPAHFVYTDYKYCVVTEIPLDGDQCQLWVSEDVKDNIPQYCLDQLEDICDVSYEEYSKELCQNDVDDL